LEYRNVWIHSECSVPLKVRVIESNSGETLNIIIEEIKESGYFAMLEGYKHSHDAKEMKPYFLSKDEIKQVVKT